MITNQNHLLCRINYIFGLLISCTQNSSFLSMQDLFPYILKQVNYDDVLNVV